MKRQGNEQPSPPAYRHTQRNNPPLDGVQLRPAHCVQALTMVGVGGRHSPFIGAAHSAQAFPTPGLALALGLPLGLRLGLSLRLPLGLGLAPAETKGQEGDEEEGAEKNTTGGKALSSSSRKGGKH